jgi:hypothetical protein
LRIPTLTAIIILNPTRPSYILSRPFNTRAAHATPTRSIATLSPSQSSPFRLGSSHLPPFGCQTAPALIVTVLVVLILYIQIRAMKDAFINSMGLLLRPESQTAISRVIPAVG